MSLMGGTTCCSIINCYIQSSDKVLNSSNCVEKKNYEVLEVYLEGDQIDISLGIFYC